MTWLHLVFYACVFVRFFVVLNVCVLSVNYCVILYGFVLVCFCDCGWLCVCEFGYCVCVLCLMYCVLCVFFVLLFCCIRVCYYVFICERWYGMVLFVLCCVCHSCLCASFVVHNALLYGVFYNVVLYSCALFGLTHVVVCLVCGVFVWCCLFCVL